MKTLKNEFPQKSFHLIRDVLSPGRAAKREAIDFASTTAVIVTSQQCRDLVVVKMIVYERHNFRDIYLLNRILPTPITNGIAFICPFQIV